jgi:hypothetical protein
MPTKQKRTVQTKLRPSTKNEDAWRTIGRAKNKHQLEQEIPDPNKKADTKKTPPRASRDLITTRYIRSFYGRRFYSGKQTNCGHYNLNQLARF